MPSTDIAPRVDTTLREPPLYRVVFIDDSATTFEFVIQCLVEFFNYSQDRAAAMTQEIHEQGSAVVAILPHEVAEQRGIEATLCARANKFPLQIRIEPDEDI